MKANVATFSFLIIKYDKVINKNVFKQFLDFSYILHDTMILVLSVIYEARILHSLINKNKNQQFPVSFKGWSVLWVENIALGLNKIVPLRASSSLYPVHKLLGLHPM